MVVSKATPGIQLAPLSPKEFVQNLPALWKAAEQPQGEAAVSTAIVREVAQILILNNVDLDNVTFERCRIILEDLETVNMHNVTFKQSVLEFPITDTPGPGLRQAATQVLASNLQSATLNVQ